ncbi:MAG: hypothetical protein AAFR21_04150 [Pseudomonadota bacterium]
MTENVSAASGQSQNADGKVKSDLTAANKPDWRKSFASLGNRKLWAVFFLGFASGLPYVLITGTLNAWFTNENIDVKTIGVFSWVIIIYGFKFLWSPLVDRAAYPAVLSMGQRRAGILLLQGVIIACLAIISTASPQTQIGLIAIAAVLCTLAASSQDILIDAWRIEIADENTPIDVLAAVIQLGFRLAAVLGGAFALIIAARIGWNDTFRILAFLMTIAVAGVFIAPNSVIARKANELDEDAPRRTIRNRVMLPVILFWAWSFYALFSFMGFALQSPEEANARQFTREVGPLIVLASVVAPIALSAFLLRYEGTAKVFPNDKAWPAQFALDALYSFVLAPMMDIIRRLRYGAILVLILVLSYRFTDLVWGAFAYPFYLGENFGALGHTNDEVAIASKFFGALMTLAGIGIGAAALTRFGRMPCLFVGAVIAAATNLLFADLAVGGARTDAFMSATGLYVVFGALQPVANFLTLDVNMNEALSRLMLVIAVENLAVGFASAAIVAFLSSIANPRYAAVQYALFASLSMLIGSLGRGALGELIEQEGFAYVFLLTAALGLVAVVTTALEWLRQTQTGSTGDVTDA